MPATDQTAEPARKRLGRPTDRDVPRTSLDAWVAANDSSSAKLAAACVVAAELLGYPVELAPKKKSIDDMRVARSYPGLIAALLISHATGGSIGLEQWARDMLKYGPRRRGARA